ncbi:hypothetical protein GOBAR_AA26150 [Gossypium barbadense]|uniref:Uncharacterized protein n=1 Tax=Gossypium barbadense TaxID=3634 RepID=A0A2P5WTV9_GOSBA|nr:hypothetical protein GOBAR_AA26150 [Gossypium barbadense]
MSVGMAPLTAAVSREVEIEEGDELFIGSPPPALVAEAEPANEAEVLKRAINIAALSLSWTVEILPRGLFLPLAHQAFVILNKALKVLQGLDKAELQAMREAAQWRRLQGISMEGDDELLVHEVEVKVPPKRDEWMTTLPPESKHSTR